MRFVYLAVIALAMLPATTFSQSFVNGSFESTNANPGSCNYFNNSGLDAYTNGANTGYGTADNIAYVGTPSSACMYGDADDGIAYIALSSNTSKYDAIAMKVSPALEAGKHYVISFKYKATMSGPEVTLRLGYSSSNKTDGTLIANVPTPANADTNWKPVTYTFSPTAGAEWITVKAELSKFAGYSFIELDNFKMQHAAGIAVQTETNMFTLSPNPAKGYVIINCTDNKPANVNITDITGRSFQSGQYTPVSGQIKLPLGCLPAGMYLVHISNERGTVVKKQEILQ